MISDLIYGGDEYLDEIKGLFPTAKIEDASDEVHEGRISIDVEMEDEEYFRTIILNGFGEMSISAQMMDNETIKKWFVNWKRDYPEFFKEEVQNV